MNINPLFARLIGKQGNLLQPLQLMVILSVISLFLSALTIQHGLLVVEQIEDTLTLLLLILLVLLMTILPFIATFLGATLSAYDAHHKAYTSILVTPLSNMKLVQGYLLATLYKLRFGIAIIIGLSPLLVARMIAWKLNSINCTFGSQIPCMNAPTVPSTINWVVWGFMLVEFTLAQFGMLLLAVTVGVAIGLLRRKPIQAVVTSLFIITFFMSIVVPILNLIYFDDSRQLPVSATKFVITTIYLLLPYILSLGFIQWTTYWVRKVLQ